MDKPLKFALPSPNFDKTSQQAWKPKPHYLTPSGMSLLPRDKQPPPMYGKHGATIPSRYLKQHAKEQQFMESPTSNTPEKQYCEPCELELHSIDDLKRHQAQHEACPVLGCEYKGHPSVMDKHVVALHNSGLFKKFKKLSTPEEIAAWREERRKRYPTVANVLLKTKAKEQRQKRGERLEMNKNRFGKINDRKRAQPYTRENSISACDKVNHINNKRSRKNKHNKKSKAKELNPKVQNEEKLNNGKHESEFQFHCSGIKMFTGTCQLTDYKHFNDNEKSAPQNVLFGLVGMYGSDDDGSDENATDNENHLENIETMVTECEAKTNIISEENPLQQEDYKEYIKKIGPEKIKQLIPSSNLNIPASEKVANSVINKDNENNNTKQDNSSDEAPEETSIQKSIPDYPLKSVNNPKLISLDVAEAKCSKSLEQAGYKEHVKKVGSEKIEQLIPSSNLNTSASEKVANSVINEDNEYNNTKQVNSSDEAPEEIPIQRSIPDYPLKSINNPKLTSLDVAETKCNKPIEESKMINQKRNFKRKSGLDYRKARLRKQNTMLEKLLESDIRHERNVLLQCVRYVCENNFFNIHENKKQGQRIT